MKFKVEVINNSTQEKWLGYAKKLPEPGCCFVVFDSGRDETIEFSFVEVMPNPFDFENSLVCHTSDGDAWVINF